MIVGKSLLLLCINNTTDGQFVLVKKKSSRLSELSFVDHITTC